MNLLCVDSCWSVLHNQYVSHPLPIGKIHFPYFRLSWKRAGDLVIAVGVWYKGINRNLRSVCDGIRLARRNQAEGRQVYCMHNQHIAGGKFVVKFRTLDGLGN